MYIFVPDIFSNIFAYSIEVIITLILQTSDGSINHNRNRSYPHVCLTTATALQLWVLQPQPQLRLLFQQPRIF